VARATGTSAHHRTAVPFRRPPIGVDLRGLRGRQLAIEDFAHFDEILVMDADNLERVLDLEPADSRAQVSRLLRYAGQPGQDVPDPYFGGEAGFQQVLDQLELAVEGLLASLRQRLGGA